MKIRINFGMIAIPMAAGLIFAQPKPAAPKAAAPAPATPAAASPAAPDAAGSKPVTEAQMDEVVVQANSRVTGSKTDVPVHDTPASIITVPKEVIEDQMAVDMNSMVRNVSGVNPQLAGGYGFADSYTIRGLNMRFLRDGFADGAAFNGYMRTMTDIESVEVLKGPGSALYGRNEPGGAINITTKKPQEKAHASAEFLTGFWNTYRLAADVGAPLANDKVLTRLNTAYYTTDGYRGLSRQIIEVLPTITWKISEKHSLMIDYDFRSFKIKPDNYGIPFDSSNSLAAVSPSTTYYSPYNNSEQTIHRPSLYYEGRFSEFFKLRSTLIYDNRNVSFVRNAGFTLVGDIAKRDTRAQTDKSNSILQQNEAVFKFRTGEIGHTLLTGLEFEYTRLTTVRTGYGISGVNSAQTQNMPWVNIFSPVTSESDYTAFRTGSGFDRLLEMYTASAYVQEQVTITKQLKARAGLRLDHVDASDSGSVTNANAQNGNLSTAQRTVAMARDLLSWQAGAVYQPWEPVSFYTGYAQGRTILMNTEATALFTEPETSTQVEAGKKMTLFRDRLQTNLAFFYTTRTNYYATDATGNTSLLAGPRVTKGIELDISGNPVAGLWLIYSSAFMDSKVQGDEYVSVTTATSPTATATTRYSITGTVPQYVPEYQGSLWATYELQSGILKGFGFGGGPTFKSGVYVDARNLQRIPGYIVADAVLFYKRQNWQVQINFRNITNEIYYATPTFAGALPSEPFNFTVSAKARL